VTVDLLGESLPFPGGIQRMEAAPIKGETEWRSLNAALEEVQHGILTSDVRIGSFLPGLLNRNLRCVNADYQKALLREPNCVISSSASDFQSLAGSNGRSGHGLNQVEIRLANVPRGRAFSVLFVKTIFDRHIGFPWWLPFGMAQQKLVNALFPVVYHRDGLFLTVFLINPP
jgi:hypothetical protein